MKKENDGNIKRECLALRYPAGSNLKNTILQAKSISKINENALVEFEFNEATYFVDGNTDTDGMYEKCMKENLSFTGKTYDFSGSNSGQPIEDQIHLEIVDANQERIHEKTGHIESVRHMSRKIPKLNR